MFIFVLEVTFGDDPIAQTFNVHLKYAKLSDFVQTKLDSYSIGITLEEPVP